MFENIQRKFKEQSSANISNYSYCQKWKTAVLKNGGQLSSEIEVSIYGSRNE